MIIGLRDWGVDVDVTPCFGKGFRIRGTSDSGEHLGRLFSSLEIRSYDANGIMTCTDGCQYRAIGAASIGRCNARLQHLNVVCQLVSSYTSFHEFLKELTAWTNHIQPLPSLQELPLNRTNFLFNKFNKGAPSVAAHVRDYLASTKSAAAVPSHKPTGIPDKDGQLARIDIHPSTVLCTSLLTLQVV
jgi:hypothetical protein